MALSALDWVVIGAYFTLTMLVGLFMGRFVKGSKDFFSGGKKVPWWMGAISSYMESQDFNPAFSIETGKFKEAFAPTKKKSDRRKTLGTASTARQTGLVDASANCGQNWP